MKYLKLTQNIEAFQLKENEYVLLEDGEPLEWEAFRAPFKKALAHHTKFTSEEMESVTKWLSTEPSLHERYKAVLKWHGLKHEDLIRYCTTAYRMGTAQRNDPARALASMFRYDFRVITRESETPMEVSRSMTDVPGTPKGDPLQERYLIVHVYKKAFYHEPELFLTEPARFRKRVGRGLPKWWPFSQAYVRPENDNTAVLFSLKDRDTMLRLANAPPPDAPSPAHNPITWCP